MPPQTDFTFRPPEFSAADNDLNLAYATACGDLAGNILPRQAGLLATPRPVIVAGLHYPGLWLRDASVNAWNAGSLVAPQAARDGLLAVVEHGAKGYVLPHPDYYDGVIWIAGAWNQACTTGDTGFLQLALDISRDVLARFRDEEFCVETGLYRGGSFFNDGVSGYPARYARPTGEWGNILDWVRNNPLRVPIGGGLRMQCLSTNCLHVLGLEAAASMADALGRTDEPGWKQHAHALRQAIRRHFWDAAARRLNYLIDAEGMDSRQEIGGWAFACLAGILEPGEQSCLGEQVERMAYGTPSLWPPYERYLSAGGLGRHSGLVWPHVLSFWGEACARRGDSAGLGRELNCLAQASLRHGNFTECWHPLGGGVDGGLQERHDGSIQSWTSKHRTSWGATGFLRLVYNGIVGLRSDWDHCEFKPCLPASAGPVQIKNLRWRNLEFSLTLEGSGAHLVRATVNGVPNEGLHFTAGDSGHRDIAVTLAPQ